MTRVEGMPGLEFDLIGLEAQAARQDEDAAREGITEAKAERARTLRNLRAIALGAGAGAAMLLAAGIAASELATPGSGLNQLIGELAAEAEALLAGVAA